MSLEMGDLQLFMETPPEQEEIEDRPLETFSCHSRLEKSELDIDNAMQAIFDAKEAGRVISEADIRGVVEKNNVLSAAGEGGRRANKVISLTIQTLEEGVKVKKEEIEDKKYDRKVRTYNGKDQKMKIKYAAPKKDAENNIKPMLVMFGIIGVCVGIFTAITANNYIQAGKQGDALTAILQGLIGGYSMNFSAFAVSTMIPAFFIGFALVAVIALLAITSRSEKVAARVGKEHGKARLATETDIKKYRNQFME